MAKMNSLFENKLHLLLCKKKFDDVLSILKRPESDKFITENVWDIINLVCLTVKTNKLLKSNLDVTSCQKIFFLLINKGNPKEVLESLLEQADSFMDDVFFCMLLNPLQLILKKIPGKRGKSLHCVLSALNAHIETLNTPQELDLSIPENVETLNNIPQDLEKLLLNDEFAVVDTIHVLSHYKNFIEYFVDEVSFENLREKEVHYLDRICNQQEIMHRYILKLFCHPLIYHDLRQMSDFKPKNYIRIICESYVKCLSKICHNVFNLFKYDLSTKHDKNSSLGKNHVLPLLAFSNLSYLIFVENIAVDFQPFIYNHHFIFMKNLKYVLPLLKRKEHVILSKGLHLAQTLLSQLEELELNYDCMELEVFMTFPRRLLDITIFSEIEIYRKLAMDVFLTYISKCNGKGRYHLIMQVLSTVNHSGTKGVLINLYTDYLHDALNGDATVDYFLGRNLNYVFEKVCVLKKDTDILENSGNIIASLNLFIYLLLRDKKENNVTGIWDLVTSISEGYINRLIVGVSMSRATTVSAIYKFNNKSKMLPSISAQFQQGVFKKALDTFDVIETLLSRIKELVPI